MRSAWRIFVHLSGFGLLAIGVLGCVVLLGSGALGYGQVAVASGSMSPALHTGDVVVLRPATVDNVTVGAVVNFRAAGGYRIHRVIAITPWGYQTQGDANPSPDRELVVLDDITGVQAWRVPYAGHLALWSVHGLSAGLAAGALVLAGVVWCARRCSCRARRSRPGPEQAGVR